MEEEGRPERENGENVLWKRRNDVHNMTGKDGGLVY